MRNKAWPYWPHLQVIFGKDRANGVVAEDLKEAEIEYDGGSSVTWRTYLHLDMVMALRSKLQTTLHSATEVVSLLVDLPKVYRTGG